MDVVSVAVPAHEKGKDADEKVIYEEVMLTQCLDALLGSEALEYSCPHCRKTVHAIKSVISHIQMFWGSFLVIQDKQNLHHSHGSLCYTPKGSSSSTGSLQS
jgi:uncharacterized UBP type Zn finger protein